MNQLYVYICALPVEPLSPSPHLSHHSALGWAPCAAEQLPTSCLFTHCSAHTSVPVSQFINPDSPLSELHLWPARFGNEWAVLVTALYSTLQSVPFANYSLKAVHDRTWWAPSCHSSLTPPDLTLWPEIHCSSPPRELTLPSTHNPQEPSLWTRLTWPSSTSLPCASKAETETLLHAPKHLLLPHYNLCLLLSYKVCWKWGQGLPVHPSSGYKHLLQYLCFSHPDY